MAQSERRPEVIEAPRDGDDAPDLQASLLAEYRKSEGSTASILRLIIAGRCVVVNFANDEPRNLFQPSLRQLETDDDLRPVDLEIYCFAGDRAPRSWVEEAGLPVHPNHTVERGAFRCCDQGHTLFAYDRSRAQAFYWVRHAGAFQAYLSRPFTRILAWAASDWGLSWLHAACVGTDDGAVLIPGPGGRGKSTIAAACLVSGMRYSGDDFNLLDGDKLEVFGLYGNITLSSTSVQLLRALPGSEELVPVFRDNKSKHCCYLPEQWRCRMAGRLPLRAILVPELVQGRTVIVPAKRDEVMPAFVSSIQMARVLGGESASLLRSFYDVAGRVRTGRLIVGDDLSELPRLISAFVR